MMQRAVWVLASEAPVDTKFLAVNTVSLLARGVLRQFGGRSSPRIRAV